MVKEKNKIVLYISYFFIYFSCTTFLLYSSGLGDIFFLFVCFSVIALLQIC